MHMRCNINQRISEIKIEACKWASENAPIAEYENACEQKFAELIIQKCIAQIAIIGISNFENEDISWTVCTAIDNIKEHFGVKNERTNSRT